MTFNKKRKPRRIHERDRANVEKEREIEGTSERVKESGQRREREREMGESKER